MVADLPSDKPVSNSTDARNVPLLEGSLPAGVALDSPAVLPPGASYMNGLARAASDANPSMSFTKRSVPDLATPFWIEKPSLKFTSE